MTDEKRALLESRRAESDRMREDRRLLRQERLKERTQVEEMDRGVYDTKNADIYDIKAPTARRRRSEISNERGAGLDVGKSYYRP